MNLNISLRNQGKVFAVTRHETWNHTSQKQTTIVLIIGTKKEYHNEEDNVQR